ncbi:hypothetical protein MHYP_G00160730 [Metynnis hypsauchen]
MMAGEMTEQIIKSSHDHYRTSESLMQVKELPYRGGLTVSQENIPSVLPLQTRSRKWRDLYTEACPHMPADAIGLPTVSFLLFHSLSIFHPHVDDREVT